MILDLMDLSAFTNISFGFDNYALRIQDLDPDLFNGQTFTVNLGSVEEALQANGSLGDSLSISQAVLNILVNQTTSSVKLSQNLFADSTMENVSNSTNDVRLSYTMFLTDILFQSRNESLDIGSIIVFPRLSNRSSFIPQNPVEVSFLTVDMVINFNS